MYHCINSCFAAVGTEGGGRGACACVRMFAKNDDSRDRFLTTLIVCHSVCGVEIMEVDEKCLQIIQKWVEYGIFQLGQWVYRVYFFWGSCICNEVWQT